MLTYNDWLCISKNILIKFNISNYNYYLYSILSYVNNIPLDNLFLYKYNYLLNKNLLIMNNLLSKVIRNIPIEFYINKIYFWSYFFEINNNSFIPRIETECLIDFILNYIDNNKFYNILDLGTGVGNIAICLSKNIKKSYTIGIDINLNSIELARKNSLNLNSKNIHFILCDWFNFNSKIKFDIIVSNPPYISLNELNLCNKSILYEPKKSLISNNSGLYDIKYLINKFYNFLKDNGLIIFEHGFNQDYLIKLLLSSKFKIFNKLKDNNNIKRFSYGIK
ncbi:release factor glutamine methyltransferase [endosymbiont of Sipalinus gigas]|uniref:peptide chain release factor N(5)-glutamine methyltransferase n=1 Tax=endosymbiont of Sipalinus gigas TaxID=1972134 RepID=UPI000DC728FF|nr:peptide chain release factor N(5)-glutamine methyltransferase [endosymbiont of Sipalinus gigas]BBA85205.1 release factor glutamine methyltransferase [endosymbiont of Sipalinus gigas]